MSELSSASILRISDAKTMQLIDLYYKEECLWNTKIKAYKNREKRSLAAEKIANILDLPNFTAKHVVMKFKNLRNSYSQEQKKIAHSIASGDTGDDVYTPKVFWYVKLNSFIKPHIQGKTPKDEASMYRLDQSAEEWVDFGNADQVLDADTTLTEPHSVSPSDGERSNDCPKLKRRKHHKYTTSKTRSEIAEEKSVSQSLKDIQSHLHVLMSHNDDYHDTFGKYVASLLRSLPPQKALALQPKIVALITGTGLENDKEEQPESTECQSSLDYQMKTDGDDSE